MYVIGNHSCHLRSTYSDIGLFPAMALIKIRDSRLPGHHEYLSNATTSEEKIGEKPTVLENSLGDSKLTGPQKQQYRRSVTGQSGTRRLERRLGVLIIENQALMSWIAGHAAELLNKYQKLQYERTLELGAWGNFSSLAKRCTTEVTNEERTKPT